MKKTKENSTQSFHTHLHKILLVKLCLLIKGLSNRLAYLFDETGIPIVTRKSFSLDYIRYVLQEKKNTFHYIGTSSSKYQTHISIWMAQSQISMEVYHLKYILQNPYEDMTN